jgi:hypothetical protein
MVGIGNGWLMGDFMVDNLDVFGWCYAIGLVSGRGVLSWGRISSPFDDRTGGFLLLGISCGLERYEREFRRLTASASSC